MEGLLSLLLLAGLFYLMMRFGCGAHMVHGHHGGHAESESSAKDPVCAMPIETGKGYTKAYASKRYWFCSRSCLDKFEAEPQKYLAASAKEEMK